MMHIYPAGGWALAMIVELDHFVPGLAGHFLRASDERRQVICAYLAAPRIRRGWSAHEEHARLLNHGNHETILAAAYGEVPRGFRSALRRSGNQPHKRWFYRYLHRLLSDPRHGSAAAVVEQLAHIDLHRLRIAVRLPAELRYPKLVATIRDVPHARQTAALFGLFVENGMDGHMLARALREADTPRQISNFWQRWAERTVFPEHPIPASPEYSPIPDATTLKRVAQRYRNCVRRYLTDILDGSDAFAVFTHGNRETIVHLRRKNGCWIVDDVYAPHNGRVAGSTRSAALEYLASHGIREAGRQSSKSSKWQPLRELSRRWEFDGFELEGWG